MAENVDFTWITACDLGVKGGGVARAIRILKNSYIFKDKTVIEKNLNHFLYFLSYSSLYIIHHIR